ncbi:MAG: hypothetical protein ACP5SA_02270 [Candidatus Micrarchaeia archaeon]
MGILGSSIASEIILVLAIALVLFIVFKIGKLLLKIIFGIIANSILGVIAIYTLNYFFALGIPLALPEIIASALFGLPAVGTIVILKLFGVLA